MSINAEKPTRWKADIRTSIDRYNNWFMRFAPDTYRETRTRTTQKVTADLERTAYLMRIDPETVMAFPDTLPTLRMCTAPPLARDRLKGLAAIGTGLLKTMEAGKLPVRLQGEPLLMAVGRICQTITQLLDTDLFPWVELKRTPEREEVICSSTVVADRLCGALADPILRNEQEKSQLAQIGEYLRGKGYVQVQPDVRAHLTDMQPGTFSFRRNVPVGDERRVNIPIDIIIQPLIPSSDRLPVLIEAKSAGDVTNTNKRRKEEATKIRQLREEYGTNIQMLLFLQGYFDTSYLGYEAAEGLDWVWEHRIQDLELAGI